MKFNIEENDYLLAWYLIYGASLSKEFDKLKQSLYTKHQKEYNNCYKDRPEIVKYGKDFIPDNDLLYDEVMNSKFFKSLRKETVNHKLHIERMLNNSKAEINDYTKRILKLEKTYNYNIFIVHPRLERVDYVKDYQTIIWGSEKVKFDALKIILINVTKSLLKDCCCDETDKNILKVILELCTLNEFLEQVDINAYASGDDSLRMLKMKIYPYWLMYLGYIEREDFINKMIKDHIAIDITNIRINKDLCKLDIIDFFNYVIKNKDKILNRVIIERTDLI